MTRRHLVWLLSRIAFNLCLALTIHGISSTDSFAAVLDNFDLPSPAIVNTTAGDGDILIDGPSSDPAYLGTRTVIKSGNELEPGDQISLGDGSFSVVAAGDATWPMQLIYDYSGLPGGSTSFASSTGLDLVFSHINSEGQTFMDSIITIDTIAGTLDAVGVHFDDLPSGLRTDFVPFASFLGTGDLSQVVGLRFRFNDPLTAPGLDFTLTALGTNPIPEPTSLVLVVFGTLALIWRHRF